MVKELFLSVFIIGIMVGIVVIGAAYYIFKYATPPAEALKERVVSQTTVLYDKTGTQVLYEIHGEEDRKVLSHEEIPDSIRAMTIVAEDDSFYSHYGVDILSILRAARVNLSSDNIKQGGSTITQQLVRNVFLSQEKTFKRKFFEAILAIKIERKFSKDEILDMYLNQVPYGSNAYGVQAAAEVYFGKDAKDLSLDESALLASIPKATTYYSPHGNHRGELVARQKEVLVRSAQKGVISQKQVQEAVATNTLAKVMPFREPIVAPHFVFHVIEELEKLYGASFVQTGGMRVYTTLDLAMQRRAENIVKKGVERNVSYNAENAALVAMNPKNGEVLAMVGSKDYFNNDTIDGQVNVAVRLRQPGSAFKPFAYAAAFESGYQPETLLYDVPTNFGPDGSGKDYIPQNYNESFRGRVSMRQALAMSLNIPAVKTLYLAGIEKTIALAEKMGITTLTNKQNYGLALVLGGAEVKLLDATAAYGVFANDGERVSAHAIDRIVTKNETLFSNNQKSQRVISEQTARKINSILSDNASRTPTFGPASPLTIPQKTVAAKTGTTQEYRDAWTIGYTPSLAVGVWAGNNDNRPMRPGSAGVFVAAPIWQEFMKNELEDKPQETFTAYEKVETKKVLLSGVSQSSQEKEESGSSILYYVDKNNPVAGDNIDYNDPMLWRWEQSIQRYSEKNKEEKKKKK
ncbi:MAG: PBP1A family penicillin-binding protein [Candidatus Moranbacteria bacterium]|nr:PBP1A family penicillin-binding protein [Candidatus Moranbacteria bacterium]